MKKYKVPPRIVQDVLIATFLLLGDLSPDYLVLRHCTVVL